MNQTLTTDRQILDWLRDEYAQPFEGWDFSILQDRIIDQGKLDWDYKDIVRDHLHRLDDPQDTRAILDIGTGGGEILADILTTTGFTGDVHATEDYPPNVIVARERLAPFGTRVHDTTSVLAQFPPGSFDLVIDRHAGDFTPQALMQLLRSGGRFITQQVGKGTDQELRDYFGVPATPIPKELEDVQTFAAWFADAGFLIERVQADDYAVRFMDAGALVRYIKAVPWEVPGFSVDHHANALTALHRRSLDEAYAIDATFRAYLLIVRTPD